MGLTVLSVVVVLAVAVSQVLGQAPFFGSCPNQNVVQNFNVNSYLGKWYEQEKYFAIFQAGGKCVTADYTDKGNGVVGVENKQVNILTNRAQSIVGTATAENNSGDGKLVVRFPSVGNFAGKYWVLNTDYTSYALVWSCNDVLGFLNAQFMWILTREKNPSAQLMTNIYNIIEQRKLSTKRLTKTKQDCQN